VIDAPPVLKALQPVIGVRLQDDADGPTSHPQQSRISSAIGTPFPAMCVRMSATFPSCPIQVV
jgi:hypothetical protein